MKTPDETKKVLEHCIETGMGCHMCDYVVRCLKVVRGKPIMQDAFALIQQLEADNTSKDERIQMLEAGMEQWHDVAASPGAVEDMARENYRLTQELAAVKRERDAAVSDMKRAQGCICNICKSYYRPDPAKRHYECKVFGKFSEIYENDDERPFVCGKFEWRGVCPENTEGRDGNNATKG